MQHASDTRSEELVCALYEAAVDPAGWPAALRGLLEWADADAAMLVSADDGRRRLLGAEGHDDAYLDEYRGDWLRDDPRLAPAAGIDAGRHERKLAAFQAWQAGHGFSASFADRMSGSGVAITWLLLSSCDAERQGRVAIRYGRVRRHLERALLLTRRHDELQRNSDGLTQVVDELQLGVMLLDADGSVQHANSSAWRILVREDALQLQDGRLRAVRELDDRRLQAILSRDDGDDADGCNEATGWLALPRRGGEAPYTIAVRGPSNSTGRRRVFIGDAAHPPEIRAADLGVIFDFTAREAQMCVRLLRGMNVEDAASDLGISPRTARVYLQQVYGKVGVHRQADLVRVLMCSPAAATSCAGPDAIEPVAPCLEHAAPVGAVAETALPGACRSGQA